MFSKKLILIKPIQVDLKLSRPSLHDDWWNENDSKLIVVQAAMSLKCLNHNDMFEFDGIYDGGQFAGGSESLSSLHKRNFVTLITVQFYEYFWRWN